MDEEVEQKDPEPEPEPIDARAIILDWEDVQDCYDQAWRLWPPDNSNG